jgi:hypothetical protein
MLAAKWGARTVAGFLYPLVLHHFDAAVEDIRRASAADPARWKKLLKRLDQTPAPSGLVTSLKRALKPRPDSPKEPAGPDPYERFKDPLADAENLSTVDLVRLVTEIGAVDGPTPPPEWLVDATAASIHNAIIRCLQDSDVDGALALAVAYAAVQPRHGHADRIREALTSMALMTAMLGDDDDLAATVLTWVPEHINLPNLAYNLACYHALRGGGPPMYGAIRHARRLGRTKEQFLADSDFAAFHRDAAFHGALDGGG